jgi:TRAP-type C4-dicarboxylate transport system substrate-binding protein
MVMKRLILMSVLFVLATLIGYSNYAFTAEKVIEISIAYHQGPKHLIAEAIESSFGDLEKMSGGRVKVKLYGGESLAKGREAYDVVRGGVADLAHLSVGYWPGRFELSTVGTLAGLSPNAVIGTLAMNELTDTTPYINKEFGDEIKCLTWTMTAPYRLMLKKKISTLEEIKGIRLRTPGGFITKVLEKLQASVIMMGGEEIYTSAARGLLDGFPYTLASIPPRRYYEVAKYIVDNLDFGTVVMALAINKKRWDSLPPDIQAMVLRCARDVGMRSATSSDTDDELAILYLRSKGVEFYSLSSAEVEKFAAITKAAQDAWVADTEAKGLPARATLDAFRKIINKHVMKWK